MGHVDDAHDPVGDGQAQGGQEQDAAQREAREDAVHGVGQEQPALDRRQRGPGRLANRGVRLVARLGDGGQLRLHRQRRPGAQRRHRRQPHGRVRAPQAGPRSRQHQQLPDAAVLLPGERPVEDGEQVRRDRLAQRLRRLEPHLPVRIEDPQHCQRALEGAADPVVDDDGVGAVRRRGQRLPGGRVAELVAVGDEEPVARHLQPAVGQGGEDRGRLRPRLRGEPPDGGELLLRVVGGQPLQLRRVQRCRQRGPGGEAQGEEQDAGGHGRPRGGAFPGPWPFPGSSSSSARTAPPLPGAPPCGKRRGRDGAGVTASACSRSRR